MKVCLILFMMVLLIGVVSGNGLSVIGQTIYNINKTQGTDEQIELQIKNEETFKFFNITSADDILQIPSFDLESGEIKNITATIKKNENFNGNLNLIGYYQAQIGASNQTYDIDVDYEDGINICDLTLIVGDQITWHNLVPDDIKMRNAGTGNDITVISEAGNYTKIFTIPEVLNYYFLRIGFPFTDVCQVAVLDTQGLIHNPEYDTFITLNVNFKYEPTEISLTFLTDTYSLDFNQQTQDIFKIKNTGTKTAKNINLQGDWFTFTENNFDLAIGESKNIGYTITPIILNTDETNQTYIKVIMATGNFITQEKNISVFINYQDLENYNVNWSVNEEILEEFFKFYCAQNPDKELCKPKIVYKEGTIGNVTATYTEEQIHDLWDHIFEQDDIREVFQNFVKEKLDAQDARASRYEQDQNETKNNIKELADSVEQSNAVSVFLGILFGFLTCFGILIFLIFNEQVRSRIYRFANFTKGEPTW